MSHTVSAIKQSFCGDGLANATSRLVKELRHYGRYLLLSRQLDSDEFAGYAQDHVRLAGPSDLDRIVHAWPPEFGGGRSFEAVRWKLTTRYEKGYPCLLSESNSQIQGAVWCIPWNPRNQGQIPQKCERTFEICNLFVAPECRGRGIARQLLTGALSFMASRGKSAAYSRIMPGRQASIAVHIKTGFHMLGVLHCSTTFGRERSRLVPLAKARQPDLQGLAMPPCVLLARSAWGGTLEAIRSLGSRGVPVYVFVLGRDPTPYGKSRYCREAYRVDDTGGTSVSRALTDWCRARRFTHKPLLIPMTDIWATFVAEKRSSLENDFIIGAPHPDTALKLLDKGQAGLLAATCGLDVPRSAVVKNQADLDTTSTRMTYPVIAKPLWWREKGKLDFKTMSFDSPEALLAGLAPMLNGPASVLVQEYVPGCDTDIETFMFYRDRRRMTWGCTSRKLRQSPPNAGIMASGHALDLPQLRRLSTMFLDKIDYQGLGGIEFKRRGSKLYYIETSARPEAFHGLSRRAGLDLIWLAYCDYCLGGLVEEPYSQLEAFYLDWTAFRASYGRDNITAWAMASARMLAKRPLKIAVFEWADLAPSLYLIRRRMRERCRRVAEILRAGSVRQ